MKVRIHKLAPHRNASIVGLLVLSSMVLIVLLFIFMLLSSISGMNLNVTLREQIVLISMPIINALLAYIVTFILCVTYNKLFAKRGGFEMILSKIDP